MITWSSDITWSPRIIYVLYSLRLYSFNTVNLIHSWSALFAKWTDKWTDFNRSRFITGEMLKWLIIDDSFILSTESGLLHVYFHLELIVTSIVVTPVTTNQVTVTTFVNILSSSVNNLESIEVVCRNVRRP